ncbi:MAG: N-acetylneuraminate synthase family protein [Minisyncoccota bacterium]
MNIRIGNRTVGMDFPCFVIAEIGINHNGDINIAKKLIDIAVEAGCDAVKFQKRTVELCYTKEELAKPRVVNPESGVLQLAVKRGVLNDESVTRLVSSNYEETTNGDLKYSLEFNRKEYGEIHRYCQAAGIMWFASPWDEPSVDFLEEFDPPCYKIASPRVRDEDDFLRYVRSKGRPIIMSTGACEESHIRHAVEVIGEGDLILMHCILTYPVGVESLNLRVIETLRSWFPDIPVGYSGHEVGEPTSVMAAVMGAVAVERHITLDRAMFGSDQAASLEFSGIDRLVRDIRMWEKARGDGVRCQIQSEIQNLEKLRRKIVSA